MKATRATCVLAIAALVAASCSSGDDGADQVQSADEPMVSADQWTKIPPGPLEGWEPNVVAGSAAGDTSVYVLGSFRRTDGTGTDAYEVRSDAYRYDVATGKWSTLMPPPVEHDIGLGQAVVTHDTLYLVTQDCVAGGTPDAGYWGCLDQDRSTHLRGLTYDLVENTWSDWHLPENVRSLDPNAPSQRLPQILPESSWSPDSNLFFVWAHMIYAFKPATEEWESIPVALSGGCSDGDHLYGFDRAVLTSTIENLPPATDAVRIDIPHLSITPGQEPEATEITIAYPQHLFGTRAVGSIRIGCSAAGQLITLSSSGADKAEGPWLFQRPEDDSFDELSLDIPELNEAVVWVFVSTQDVIYIAASHRRSEGDSLPVVAFDPNRGGFQALPRLDKQSTHHSFIGIGSRILLAYPNAGVPYSESNTMSILLAADR